MTIKGRWYDSKTAGIEKAEAGRGLAAPLSGVILFDGQRIHDPLTGGAPDYALLVRTIDG